MRRLPLSQCFQSCLLFALLVPLVLSPLLSIAPSLLATSASPLPCRKPIGMYWQLFITSFKIEHIQHALSPIFARRCLDENSCTFLEGHVTPVPSYSCWTFDLSSHGPLEASILFLLWVLFCFLLPGPSATRGTFATKVYQDWLDLLSGSYSWSICWRCCMRTSPAEQNAFAMPWVALGLNHAFRHQRARSHRIAFLCRLALYLHVHPAALRVADQPWYRLTPCRSDQCASTLSFARTDSAKSSHSWTSRTSPCRT